MWRTHAAPTGMPANVASIKLATRSTTLPEEGSAPAPLASTRKAERCRAFANGETPTRTGDTTIFSRAVGALERR
jgi:hypothetical protein